MGRILHVILGHSVDCDELKHLIVRELLTLGDFCENFHAFLVTNVGECLRVDCSR